LRRGSQIAVGFILANLQDGEYPAEISRFDRAPVGAAETRMDHPDMASSPSWAALFGCPAMAGANRKFHRAEVAGFAEVAPIFIVLLVVRI